jgi:hypothetical protein
MNGSGVSSPVTRELSDAGEDKPGTNRPGGSRSTEGNRAGMGGTEVTTLEEVEPSPPLELDTAIEPMWPPVAPPPPGGRAISVAMNRLHAGNGGMSRADRRARYASTSNVSCSRGGPTLVSMSMPGRSCQVSQRLRLRYPPDARGSRAVHSVLAKSRRICESVSTHRHAHRRNSKLTREAAPCAVHP